MILMVGGAYQGKLEYALTYGKMSHEVVLSDYKIVGQHLVFSKDIKVINHFHLLIRQLLMDELDVDGICNNLIIDNPHIILIGDELGCGLVPIDAFDRAYREKTGRIYCQMAKEAKEVHRILCGIGRIISHA